MGGSSDEECGRAECRQKPRDKMESGASLTPVTGTMLAKAHDRHPHLRPTEGYALLPEVRYEDNPARITRIGYPVHTVLVEAQTSSKTYEVDMAAGRCTCSTPEKPRFHLDRVRDVHAEGCKRSRFEIVSAVHKEIRRGDVDAALYWADLLSKYSESYVKNHARRVVGDPSQHRGRRLVGRE